LVGRASPLTLHHLRELDLMWDHLTKSAPLPVSEAARRRPSTEEAALKAISKATPFRLSTRLQAASASAIILGAALASSPSCAASCERLASVQIKDTIIDAAEAHPAGAYSPAGSAELANLPAFCRVHGVASPVAESQVGFEVWLPQTDWNGKIEMFGNGGYSAAMAFGPMAEQLRRGYATVATDTGHKGDDPDFALAHPEAIVDWGHRAVHVSIAAAKSVVSAFYGQTARHAYFSGCSTGGHQALMEAQRYPNDFDGIIAGDPGNNRTRLNAGFLWQFVKNHRASDLSVIVPPEKLSVVTEAVVKTCRGKDGGLPSDNFLTDPEACDFHPDALLCQSGDAADCLTQEQVDALTAMYGGAHNPRTGEQIYYGWPKGSENSGRVVKTLPGWSLYWADPAHPDRPARLNFWRIWAFQDSNWDWRSFDFDAGMKTVDDRLAPTINAMSADLSGFRKAGGKLIQFHGLADPVVPPRESIDYYERVQAAEAGGRPPQPDESRDYYRLFLAPGLYHCQGGPGPNVLDTQNALEKWVEEGAAPETIAATKFRDDKPNEGVEMSRALCRYPNVARYKGAGDIAAASSFSCVEGRRYQSPLPAKTYLR
jgi:feruloyl esterase